MMKNLILLMIICPVFIGCNNVDKGNVWSLVLNQKNERDIVVTRLPQDWSKPFTFNKTVDGISVDFILEPKERYTSFKATAKSETGKEIFLSIQCEYQSGTPHNFNGEVTSSEIFRQSPHDVNAWIVKDIAMQPVPVVAIKDNHGYEVAISNSPAFYDNFTSQSFYLENKVLELSSGDDGKTPGLKPDTTEQVMEYNAEKTQKFSPGKIIAHYHQISPKNEHVFEGILFKSSAGSQNKLRKEINYNIAHHFSNGKYDDYFGALAFTTAYMNLRVNETGKSKYWVVPAVEYGNTQYCRDAFWISTMLPPEIASECLKNELDSINQYAEYPLFAIIWAYRSFKENIDVDLSKVQAYVDAVETRARNGFFYSYLEHDGRLDFQYWGDVIAFEKDDVVTYNQGLFAVALAAAEKMGLSIKTNPKLAAQNYRSMFQHEGGYFPISQKKQVTGPDPVVPDLLAQIYLDEPLLNEIEVRQHFETITKNLKTSHGYKIIAMPNGDYLPNELYDVEGYTSQINREQMPDGRYFKGGSYFLYDNLFLINAWLHGIKEAEQELIWRVGLDFLIGSTTYECLNTKTGEPWKANMGWNVAIYSFWRMLVENKKAGNSLFSQVDRIVSSSY